MTPLDVIGEPVTSIPDPDVMPTDVTPPALLSTYNLVANSASVTGSRPLTGIAKVTPVVLIVNRFIPTVLAFRKLKRDIEPIVSNLLVSCVRLKPFKRLLRNSIFILDPIFSVGVNILYRLNVELF